MSRRGRAPDYWRMARALYAAGFRAGEIAHNTFSYHLTPGGWMLDMRPARARLRRGARRRRQQRDAGRGDRPCCAPRAFAAHPTYLLVLLARRRRSSASIAAASSRPWSPAARCIRRLRADYAARGIAVLQCYATAELGLIAYESAADRGLIVDEH